MVNQYRLGYHKERSCLSHVLCSPPYCHTGPKEEIRRRTGRDWSGGPGQRRAGGATRANRGDGCDIQSGHRAGSVNRKPLIPWRDDHRLICDWLRHTSIRLVIFWGTSRFWDWRTYLYGILYLEVRGCIGQCHKAI